MDIERINEADAAVLLAYYKEFLSKCADRFKDIMEVDEDGNPIHWDEWTNELPHLKFRPGEIDNDYSDEDVAVYYYCKYGIAYAFEYAKMYELLLRICDADMLGVSSFGCGGLIDAWALAYARARSDRTDSLKLFYKGFDIKDWARRVFQEALDSDCMEEHDFAEPFDINVGGNMHRVSHLKLRRPEVEEGIRGFDGRLYYGVLMFPKVLNELNLQSDDWRDFIQQLRNGISNARRDCYYICVSHSLSDVRNGMRAVKTIVDEFTRGGFSASDALESDQLIQEYHLVKYEAVYNEDEPWNVLYKYDESVRYIDELDENFRHRKSKQLLEGLHDSFQRKDGSDATCLQMTTVKYFVFQIIKLTRTDA